MSVSRCGWRGASTRAAVSAGEAVEEKISSVAVFLVSVDGSGNEDWNDVQYEVVYGATSGATDVYQARIPTAPGRKKVYVGANLLPGQVHAICGQAGGLGLYTAAGDGYDEVIGQFARQAEGIAMTRKSRRCRNGQCGYRCEYRSYGLACRARKGGG